jgi:hypothetical protein
MDIKEIFRQLRTKRIELQPKSIEQEIADRLEQIRQLEYEIAMLKTVAPLLEEGS